MIDTSATYWIACNSNGDWIDLDLLRLLEMLSVEIAADGDVGDGVASI